MLLLIKRLFSLMQSNPGGEQTSHNVAECRSLWLPLLIAALFVAVIFFLQTSRSTTPDHGDIWTDLQLTLQGERLANIGPSKLHYGVVLDDGHLVGLPPFYYVNWPPTGPLLVAYTFAHGRGLINARTVMLPFAAVALVLFYLLVLRLGLGRRAALAGMLALACATPFHVFADSLSYFTSDTFGRLGVLLCVLAVIFEDTRRNRIAAYLGAFLLIVFLLTFSGYETIPSLGLYAFFVPMAAAPDKPWRTRFAIAIRLCLTYAAAVGAGIWLRLENATSVIGNQAAAKSALLEAVRYRSGAAPAPVIRFLREIAQRLAIYYEWHLLVLAVLTAVCGWHYLRHRAMGQKFVPALVTITVISLSDCAWMVLVRQHTFIHNHTIHQIGPAMCLWIALGAAALLEFMPAETRIVRRVFVPASCVLGLLAFLNIGWAGRYNYGNLMVHDDWSYRIRMMEPLTSVIPPGSILVSQIGQQPEIEYALRGHGFVYLNRPLSDLPLQRFEEQEQPVYVITWRRQSAKEFQECMRRFQLVLFNLEFAIFRAVDQPGLNRALLPNANMQEIYEWNEPMWAFALHPAVAGVPLHDGFDVPLQPSPNVRFRLWTMMPGDNLPHTDGVNIELQELGESDRLLKERSLFVNPSVFQAARRWVSYPLELLDEADRRLHVKVDCGKRGNCSADLIYVFLSLDQTR